MTRMIPPTINPSSAPAAERKMFEIIRDAPDTDGWVCFHSYGLAHHPTKRHGEVDFVLLTRHGVFVLEVKGGRISQTDGVWYSVDRDDKRHKLKESPFTQATGCMHELERCIKRDFAGGNQARTLFGFGVVFPDVEFTSESPEWDNRVVYDARDRGRPFTSYINRLAQFHRSGRKGEETPRPSSRATSRSWRNTFARILMPQLLPTSSSTAYAQSFKSSPSSNGTCLRTSTHNPESSSMVARAPAKQCSRSTQRGASLSRGNAYSFSASTGCLLQSSRATFPGTPSKEKSSLETWTTTS